LHGPNFIIALRVAIGRLVTPMARSDQPFACYRFLAANPKYCSGGKVMAALEA